MNLFKRKQFLSIGEHGEKTAADYLEKSGYEILGVNFFNPTGRRLGEIDIIAKEKEELVFVEVKTRAKNTFNAVLPEESITFKKLHKLAKIAYFYISSHNMHNMAYRFDAITILFDKNNSQSEIKHLKNIFL